MQRNTTKFRKLLAAETFVMMPAAYHPLGGRQIAAAGFKGVYCGGFVTGGSRAVTEPLAEAAGRHLTPIALDTFAAGDVLLFRWRAGLAAKHAAIVTAHDRMVHAHDGAAVAEVAIAPWWRRRLAYAFRFPHVTD